MAGQCLDSIPGLIGKEHAMSLLGVWVSEWLKGKANVEP